MGPILLFINLFVLFIIVLSKITFVNHLAEYVGNIYFYCYCLLVPTLSKRVIVQVVPARVAIAELAKQLNLDQQWEGKVDFCLR